MREEGDGADGTTGGASRQEVEDKLGHVLVKAVDDSRSAKRWAKVISLPVLIDLLLSIVVCYGFIQIHHNAIIACERTNRQGVAYQKQWTPVLRAPRPPLPPNPTESERKLYDAQTDLRVQWERSLHDFDPVKC